MIVGLRPEQEQEEASIGDVVRLTPVIVDETEPLALDRLNAVWIACDPELSCLDTVRTIEELAPCETSVTSAGFTSYTHDPGCVVGTGPELERVRNANNPLFMIAGMSDAVDAEACVRLLEGPGDASQRDCVYASVQTIIGPEWPLVEVFEANELPVQVPSEEVAIPPRRQEPNAHPEFASWSVFVNDSLVLDTSHGDENLHVTASVGERVRIGTTMRAFDEQEYFVVSDEDGAARFSRASERISVEWLSSEALSAFESSSNGLEIEFTVLESGDYVLYAVAGDGRGGVAVASLAINSS